MVPRLTSLRFDFLLKSDPLVEPSICYKYGPYEENTELWDVSLARLVAESAVQNGIFCIGSANDIYSIAVTMRSASPPFSSTFHQRRQAIINADPARQTAVKAVGLQPLLDASCLTCASRPMHVANGCLLA